MEKYYAKWLNKVNPNPQIKHRYHILYNWMCFFNLLVEHDRSLSNFANYSYVIICIFRIYCWRLRICNWWKTILNWSERYFMFTSTSRTINREVRCFWKCDCLDSSFTLFLQLLKTFDVYKYNTVDPYLRMVFQYFYSSFKPEFNSCINNIGLNYFYLCTILILHMIMRSLFKLTFRSLPPLLVQAPTLHKVAKYNFAKVSKK